MHVATFPVAEDSNGVKHIMLQAQLRDNDTLDLSAINMWYQCSSGETNAGTYELGDDGQEIDSSSDDDFYISQDTLSKDHVMGASFELHSFQSDLQFYRPEQYKSEFERDWHSR